MRFPVKQTCALQAATSNSVCFHAGTVHCFAAGHLRYKQAQEAESAQQCWAAINGQATEGDVTRLRSRTAKPLILHLDSIKDGGHRSCQIYNDLRAWLRCATAARLCNATHTHTVHVHSEHESPQNLIYGAVYQCNASSLAKPVKAGHDKNIASNSTNAVTNVQCPV
jgi:hypothetical protein